MHELELLYMYDNNFEGEVRTGVCTVSRWRCALLMCALCVASYLSRDRASGVSVLYSLVRRDAIVAGLTLTLCLILHRPETSIIT